MKKIAWIIDSTAYITEELKAHPDVFMVPLYIMFGDEVYEDNVTITPEELTQKMKEYNAIPTTSQPSIGRFVELYEEIKEQYEKVIMLHVSSRLSGTYNASKQAADIVGLDYHIIDTEVMTVAITYLLEEGLYLEKKGKSFSEITDRLERIVPTLEDYILIGNLAQLHKGGRLSSAQFFLGTLLNIKPIVQIRNGIIDVYEKVRSEKKAIKLIMEKCEQALQRHDITKAAVVHGNREEDAMKWKEMILAIKSTLHIDIVPITSTLSVHAGEGTIAVLWYNTRLEA
ncbi:DegV family protein [Microbacteriaceae bacterium 4G12]